MLYEILYHVSRDYVSVVLAENPGMRNEHYGKQGIHK